jgi:hypothetical protein
MLSGSLGKAGYQPAAFPTFRLRKNPGGSLAQAVRGGAVLIAIAPHSCATMDVSGDRPIQDMRRRFCSLFSFAMDNAGS